MTETKEKNNKVKNNIPLAFDYKFKKVFGDNDAIERLEVFVSIILKIPYEQINQKLNQSTIDRDIGYGAYFYQSQLKKSQDYINLESMTEIWLDRGLENIKYDESVIIDEFYYMNKNDEILSTKSKINHIDIEKCYRIWYTNSVQNYDKLDQQIIYLGAMLSTSNIGEFKKCLEELLMPDKIKEDIEKTNEEANELDDLLSWYDRERDLNAKYRGYAHSWAKEEAQEMAQDIAKDIAKNMAKDMAQDIAKDLVKKEKMEIARKIITKDLSKSEISNITGLSIEEIENL